MYLYHLSKVIIYENSASADLPKRSDLQIGQWTYSVVPFGLQIVRQRQSIKPFIQN